MRSIIYAGHDFSRYCTAEVVEEAANGLAAEYMEVPGRAGGLPLPAHVPPRDVRVRLFLDAGRSPGAMGLSQIRATLRSWLCQPGCATLVLPSDPEREYRDALLVSAGDWSSLFETGACTLTFTLFDPVSYGDARMERTDVFDVGGTWPTLPEFRLTADAGGAVQVSYPAIGAAIRVERDFAGGEEVAIDCANETVAVDGADARSNVALGSDFFALTVGACSLGFTGCTAFETRFSERWA